MADTITISCPECAKTLKLRAELEGKTVRCKDCKHTFVVKAPPVKKPAPPKKPAAPPKPAKKDDDIYADQNPYGVTEMDLTLRCPQCAAEMESEEAILCINCGFNIKTRDQVKTVKVIETTEGDKVKWLLPGILCVVAVLFLATCAILSVISAIAAEPADSAFMQNLSNCCTLWVVIFSLFGIFYAGRFAIRRLILNPTPPDKEKN